MEVSYQSTGRVQQKARTREALVVAARDLMARGITPSVDQAAAASNVSRATAYRYFPNKRALLVAAHPEIEARSLLGPHPPTDVAARLDAVVDAILDLTIRSEPELRSMLRLSLEGGVDGDDELVLRKGRRIGWVEDALSPLRGQLAEVELRRLVLAIAGCVGIDVLVWMTDVAGLTRVEAADTMRWSARALLRSVVDEGASAAAAPPAPAPGSSSRRRPG